MGSRWPDCDAAVKAHIDGFVTLLRESLGEKLVGIYLHGSLAMGCYYAPKSDIDLLIVARSAPESDRLRALSRQMAEYSLRRPTVGDIECSLICAEAAKAVPNPMPFLLHYSESWRERIFAGEHCCGEKLYDSDLFAHMRVVKQRGCALYGRPIAETIGEVSTADYLYAILDDLDWILGGENLLESPYYGVLNSCRVLQALRENDGSAHSKEEGALWGLENLPAHAPLIQTALDIYRSTEPLPEAQRKTGGIQWKEGELLHFCDYARGAVLSDARAQQYLQRGFSFA